MRFDDCRGRYLEPQVVIEYERCPCSPVDLYGNVLLTDLRLPEVYRECISDDVWLRLWFERLTPARLRPCAEGYLCGWEKGFPISENDSFRFGEGRTGLMVHMPMSPVSVVVFNMPPRAPGEGSKIEFSLTALRGL